MSLICTCPQTLPLLVKGHQCQANLIGQMTNGMITLCVMIAHTIIKTLFLLHLFVFLLNCLVLSFDLNIVQIAVRPAVI